MSAGTPSIHDAFPFFVFLSTCRTHFSVMLSMFISWISLVSEFSIGFAGASLTHTSSKCLAYPSSCAVLSVTISQLLSLTVADCWRRLFEIFLAAWYRHFVLRLSADCPAALPMFSTHSLLFSLATSRSFTLYSSHSFFFILSEQVLWILSFFFSVARLAAVLLRALKHVVRCLCVDILHLLTVLVYVPSTSRAWNLFRISTLNLVLNIGFPSFWVSKLWFHLFPVWGGCEASSSASLWQNNDRLPRLRLDILSCPPRISSIFVDSLCDRSGKVTSHQRCPHCFVCNQVGKACSFDSQSIYHKEVTQPLSIVVPCAESMSPHNLLHALAVRSNLCFEVSYDDQHVMLVALIHCGLKFFAKSFSSSVNSLVESTLR